MIKKYLKDLDLAKDQKVINKISRWWFVIGSLFVLIIMIFTVFSAILISVYAPSLAENLEGDSLSTTITTYIILIILSIVLLYFSIIMKNITIQYVLDNFTRKK
jgi:uncharacterized membrane protein